MGIVIVYYFDEDLKSCPVKEYFNQYGVDENDELKERNRKQKLLIAIDAKIQAIAECQCIPRPPIASPVHGYNFHEIKHRKDKNILIRILFCRFGEKMVLLHAFEKPDNYDTERQRKIVDNEYQTAQKYFEKFKLTPKNYEEYL